MRLHTKQFIFGLLILGLLGLCVSPFVALDFNPYKLPLTQINPSDTIVYMTEQQYKSGLYLLQVKSHVKTQFLFGEYTKHSPAWSPDGCTIAYVSNNRRGIISDIFTIDIESRKITNITELLKSEANLFTSPVWSPDGNHLAYESNEGEGYGLHILDLTTLEDIRVTDTTLTASSPDWSPLGDQIVFHAKQGNDDNFDIYAIGTDGSHLTNLTNNPSYDTDPSWSPDGQKIAFSSKRDGNWELYIMDADGSNPKRLTVNEETDVEPKWAPDGDHLVFSSTQTGNWEIYMIDPDGSYLEQLTDEPFVIHQNPSWQPKLCGR